MYYFISHIKLERNVNWHDCKIQVSWEIRSDSPAPKDPNCSSSELNHHIQTIRNRLMGMYSEITEINLHPVNKLGKSGQGLEESHPTLGQKDLLETQL